MRTPASIKGHPLHAMLIVFPVGLLIFSFVCDLVSLFVAEPGTWRTVAFYTMAGGVVGALVAAVPGLIDLISLQQARVKKIAVTHMTLNLVVVAMFVFNLWLRYNGADNPNFPIWLSLIAVTILAVSGWLGAEMVHRHGVGVETGDATASSQEALKTKTAHATVPRHQH